MLLGSLWIEGLTFYIIIFIYVRFLPWKVIEVYKNVSESLGRLIVPWTIIVFLEVVW